MELSGPIKFIGETEEVTPTFKKRDLVVVIDQDTNYPQPILIQFVQDKCGLLDSVVEGEEVTVSTNLRGKEYTNPQGEVKYFNSIVGWRIEKSGNPIPQNPQIPQEPLPGEEEDPLPY